MPIKSKQQNIMDRIRGARAAQSSPDPDRIIYFSISSDFTDLASKIHNHFHFLFIFTYFLVFIPVSVKSILVFRLPVDQRWGAKICSLFLQNFRPKNGWKIIPHPPPPPLPPSV